MMIRSHKGKWWVSNVVQCEVMQQEGGEEGVSVGGRAVLRRKMQGGVLTSCQVDFFCSNGSVGRVGGQWETPGSGEWGEHQCFGVSGLLIGPRASAWWGGE